MVKLRDSFEYKFIMAIDRFGNWCEKVSKKGDLKFILMLYVFAFLTFLITLVQNYFVIPVSGDFILQEIPFYYNAWDDWRTFLNTGVFPQWDPNTFLGSSNIGSNTFYYLFNPFIIPVVLMPRVLVPQMQAFMIITKIVLAGYAMRKLLQSFKISDNTAYLLSLAYAFCGWNFFYLWFNHFFEITVMFPVFLLGIERVLKEKKPFLLVISIAIVGVMNYFFLIAFCFCGVLYALVRYFQLFKSYTKVERVEVLGKGIAAFAIGLMFSAIVLLPAFKVVELNPRTDGTYLPRLTENLEALKTAITSFDFSKIGSAFEGFFKTITEWNVGEQYRKKYLLYPLATFFYPTISSYDALLFKNTGYDNTLASLYIFVPIMLMLVPSVYYSIKKKKVSHIISLLFILFLLFTPFAYYCFSGFTSVAYGRWQIFVVAVAIIYIAHTFDHRDEIPKFALDVGFVMTMAICIWLSVETRDMVGTAGTSSLADNADWYQKVQTGIYVYWVYIAVVYFYLRKNFKSKDLTKNLFYIVALEAIVMGNIVQIVQGTSSYANLYHGKDNVTEETQIVSDIQDYDKGFYRIFNTSADKDGVNLAMIESYNGVATFHSLFNYHLEDFLKWSQITYHRDRGSWDMGVHEKRVNLDEFLNIKYYIVKSGDNNVPYGFKIYRQYENHDVYYNENFIELGFSYSDLIPSSAVGRSIARQVNSNEIGYLSAGVLSEEDLTEVLEENSELTRQSSTTFKGNTMTRVTNYTSELYRGVWENGEYKGVIRDDNRLGLTWNSYEQITYRDEFPVCPDAATRGGCYVSVNARMGENLEISLYGENETYTNEDDRYYLLTKDRHITHWYGGKQNYDKHIRGFYVNEEVKRIVIRVYDTFAANASLEQAWVEYEYYDTFKERVDQLKEYPLENIKISVDNYRFTTDFDKTRFIVLSVPYDFGWKVKITDEDGKTISPKIYKATGGFVGFVAPSGSQSYHLEFYTNGLESGIKIMAIGMTLLSVLFVYDQYISEDKKRIARLTSFR